jgi:hypothetical protein
MKELFKTVVKNSNHKNRRLIKKLKLEKMLDAIDSTVIKISPGLKNGDWCAYKSNTDAIKLHVRLSVDSNLPVEVHESAAKPHDINEIESLRDASNILTADRGYAKLENFDEYTRTNQLFVIRIKSNVTITKRKSLKRIIPEKTNVKFDFTCLLGSDDNYQTKNRFRV